MHLVEVWVILMQSDKGIIFKQYVYHEKAVKGEFKNV
jgi:hypothetical protein